MDLFNGHFGLFGEYFLNGTDGYFVQTVGFLQENVTKITMGYFFYPHVLN
jgi:hypothetical protein